jgi:hypothetical protein
MVSKSRCSTVVLHRQKPAVRELPDFEGLFRYRKSVAEREGFEPPIAQRGCESHNHAAAAPGKMQPASAEPGNAQQAAAIHGILNFRSNGGV